MVSWAALERILYDILYVKVPATPFRNLDPTLPALLTSQHWPVLKVVDTRTLCTSLIVLQRVQLI